MQKKAKNGNSLSTENNVCFRFMLKNKLRESSSNWNCTKILTTCLIYRNIFLYDNKRENILSKGLGNMKF